MERRQKRSKNTASFPIQDRKNKKILDLTRRGRSNDIAYLPLIFQSGKHIHWVISIAKERKEKHF